jgi:hypothetical protein
VLFLLLRGAVGTGDDDASQNLVRRRLCSRMLMIFTTTGGFALAPYKPVDQLFEASSLVRNRSPTQKEHPFVRVLCVDARCSVNDTSK